MRRWLLANEADRYVCPSHARAIAYLYRTPRVYLDATTLVDPNRLPRGPRIDTRDLALALRSMRRGPTPVR